MVTTFNRGGMTVAYPISLRKSSVIVLPVVLFLGGLALRLAIIEVEHFDGLYGQDPFAYYDYAITLREHLTAARLPPPFYWPIGYPLIVALTFSLFGVTPTAAQAVNAVAGAAVGPLVYFFTRELLLLEGRPSLAAMSARVAGMVSTFSGTVLLSSVVIMSDITALFWSTLAATALIRYLGVGKLRWVLIAAFAFAWAIGTRYICGLLAVPFAALFVYRLRRLNNAQGLWRDLAIAGLVAAAILIPIATVNMQARLADHGTQISHTEQIFGQWSWKHGFTREISNPTEGRFHFRLPNAVYYLMPVVHPFFLSPLFLPAIAWSVFSMLRQRRWLVAMFLGIWVGTLYVFLVGIPLQNARYAIGFLPALAAFAGVGLAEAAEEFTEKSSRIVTVYLTIAVLSMLIWNGRAIHTFVGKKNRDMEVVRWLQEMIPAQATVFTFALTLTLDHYSSFRVIELYDCTPDNMRRIIGENRDVFVAVHVQNLQQQWSGLRPQSNYEWLRQHYRLKPLAEISRYTIFRVESP